MTFKSDFVHYRLPPPPSNPCRYGDPFRGGSSPVITYRAGVGSKPNKADIVSLREVRWKYQMNKQYRFYLRDK